MNALTDLVPGHVVSAVQRKQPRTSLSRDSFSNPGLNQFFVENVWDSGLSDQPDDIGQMFRTWLGIGRRAVNRDIRQVVPPGEVVERVVSAMDEKGVIVNGSRWTKS